MYLARAYANMVKLEDEVNELFASSQPLPPLPTGLCPASFILWQIEMNQGRS